MGADGGEFWGGIHRDKQDVAGYGAGWAVPAGVGELIICAHVRRVMGVRGVDVVLSV